MKFKNKTEKGSFRPDLALFFSEVHGIAGIKQSFCVKTGQI